MSAKSKIILTFSDELKNELIENEMDIHEQIQLRRPELEIKSISHPASQPGSKDIIQIIEIITTLAPGDTEPRGQTLSPMVGNGIAETKVMPAG